MEWFKFYKKDFLIDTKLLGIDPLMRLIWVTLLCLCDDEGEIKYLKEYDLIKLANCDDDTIGDLTDFDRTKGCLKYFEERGMIALQTVTDSNAERNDSNVTQRNDSNVTQRYDSVTSVTDRNNSVTYHVTLCNYQRRQTSKLSNVERQKNFRERHKIASKTVKKHRNDSNVTQRYDSNARIEKNRVEKNRIDNIYRDPHILDDFNFISSLKEKFPDISVETEIEKMKDWLASSGKKKKDYAAFARNWLREAKPTAKSEEVLIIP